MDCNKLELLLHFYASRGMFHDVESLVHQELDLNVKNSANQTPLMLAAKRSHIKVVELLINSGADIHWCDDDRGWTVLHHACFGGSVEIVQCLVSNGVSLDVKNSKGETPLILAIKRSSRRVVELLINSGADIHWCDYRGWTLLHHACFWRSEEVIYYLVSKGVALDQQNIFGQTPLHFAGHSNKLEIAEHFLDAGADCNLKDIKRVSPFNYVMWLENYITRVKTISLYIEKGAYVNATEYNILLNKPELKTSILKDVKLCSQAVINKFNNKDLPLLYKRHASVQKLPHIDKLKIRNGSGMAREVEKAVTHEIQTQGFCDILKIVPSVLSVLCVKSANKRSRSVLNQRILSKKGLKRLKYHNKQKYLRNCFKL